MNQTGVLEITTKITTEIIIEITTEITIEITIESRRANRAKVSSLTSPNPH